MIRLFLSLFFLALTTRIAGAQPDAPAAPAPKSVPAPDAKRLTLHLNLTEAIKTGRNEKITLADVPAPTKPRDRN